MFFSCPNILRFLVPASTQEPGHKVQGAKHSFPIERHLDHTFKLVHKFFASRNTLTSTMGKEDTFVYIKDPDFAWVPATLDKTEGDKAYVTVPLYPNEQSIASDNGRGARGQKELVVKLTDYPHKVLPLQNVDNKGRMQEHADMVQLPYLHEVSLVP
jgi:hypothetical protein